MKTLLSFKSALQLLLKLIKITLTKCLPLLSKSWDSFMSLMRFRMALIISMVIAGIVYWLCFYNLLDEGTVTKTIVHTAPEGSNNAVPIPAESVETIVVSPTVEDLNGQTTKGENGVSHSSINWDRVIHVIFGGVVIAGLIVVGLNSDYYAWAKATYLAWGATEVMEEAVTEAVVDAVAENLNIVVD